jgi:hypothetical protein
MVTLKDVADLQFPRYLHKETVQQECPDARTAVEMIAAGWTLRPGEPVNGAAPKKADPDDAKSKSTKKG